MAQRRSIGGAILLSVSLALGGTSLGGASPTHQGTRASGVLLVGSTQEPDSLNPLITQLVVGYDVDSAVYDGLLNTDATGQQIPQLATSVDHSADGLRWTFHLRHAVLWADGQPFSSADVAYTYSAILNKHNNVSNTTGWDQIDKLTTPDPYTVVCLLKGTYAPFVSYIGSTSILPKHVYDKAGVDFNKTTFNRTPFGTGPYMVTEWKTADHITLVPNPHYWGKKPFFTQVIYKIVPNSQTQLVQLRTGDLDLAKPDQAQIDAARQISGKHLVAAPSTNWWHIDLKQMAFLREKVVRQALDYATPKEQILKGILKGAGELAYGDIPPLLKQYYNPNVPKHPYNLAKAAALLAADGFTKGPNGVLQKGGQPFVMELWVSSDNLQGQFIEQVLKNTWAHLGIQVSLHTATPTALYGPNGPQFTKAMTGIGYHWCNCSADPDDSYYWNSSQIPTTPTGAGGDLIGYFFKFDFQKQIDDLTNAGLHTVDTGKRRAIYFQIQALLADEVPDIFIDWEPLLYEIPNDLSGFTPNPFNSLFWNIADWHR